MKCVWQLAGLCIVLVGLVFVPMANADSIYDFSINLTTGFANGTLAGTIDLPFVNPGGSGTGAASSIAFTAIPAGFGALVGGNVPTNWAHQVANNFTVTAGTITSDEVFMLTGGSDPADSFVMNSSATDIGSFGIFTGVGDLNELHVANGVFSENSGGLGGVTFTLVSTVPEPSSLLLLGTGLAGLLGAVRRRARR